MAEMTDALNRLEGDRDRTDARVEGIGSALAEEQGARQKETATPEGPRPAPAALRSVSLGGDDTSNESDDPNDPTARPEIKLVGPPGAASRGARRAARVDEPEPRAEPVRPSGGDANERPRESGKKGGRDGGSRSSSGARSEDSAKGPKESR
jgi:hypothetical protein